MVLCHASVFCVTPRCGPERGFTRVEPRGFVELAVFDQGRGRPSSEREPARRTFPMSLPQPLFSGHGCPLDGKSLSWRIATVLGNTADPAVNERWEFFAADPDEPPGSSMSAGKHRGVIEVCRNVLYCWLEKMEPHEVLFAHLVASNPHLDLYTDAGAEIHELICWGRLDGFAALRARAADLYSSGLDGCRAKCARARFPPPPSPCLPPCLHPYPLPFCSDATCPWMSTEWVADKVLNIIVKDLERQGVDIGEAGGNIDPLPVEGARERLLRAVKAMLIGDPSIDAVGAHGLLASCGRLQIFGLGDDEAQSLKEVRRAHGEAVKARARAPPNNPPAPTPRAAAAAPVPALDESSAEAGSVPRMVPRAMQNGGVMQRYHFCRPRERTITKARERLQARERLRSLKLSAGD